MAQRTDHLKNEIVDKVAALARAKLDKSKVDQAERFLRRYFAHVPPGDMARHAPESLLGSALAALHFIRKRPPNAADVRLYNPRAEEDGWQSDHTVVEIVNDDMPFLVDSITAELNRLGMAVHLVIHPILHVARDKNGALADVRGGADNETHPESLMHFEVSQVTDMGRLKIAEQSIRAVLEDVRAAVEDWGKMRERLKEILAAGKVGPKGVSAEEMTEAQDFLIWMEDDHFTFLGYRDYLFSDKNDGAVAVDPKTGLGVLRDPDVRAIEELRDLARLPPDVRAFVSRPNALLISKTDASATVHRAAPMDLIGIKRFDAQGRMIGLMSFVGLFTADVYTSSPMGVPILKSKIARIIERAGLPPNSHAGKRLIYTLENLPRDELFQAGDEHLFETAMGIVHLQERQRVALFARRDEFDRFVSCLVFVPRDRYDTALRLAVRDILESAFEGKQSVYYTQVGDSPLARLHFIIRTTGSRRDIDIPAIEAQLAEATRSWADRLQDALVLAKGEETGLSLFQRYGAAFPGAYRERFNADIALHDIALLEEAAQGDGTALNLYRPLEAAETELRLKIYRRESAVALSDVLPMMEHMGFRVLTEVPFAIALADGSCSHIHDFALECAQEIDLHQVRDRVQEAFRRVLRGEMEDDGFNRLVASADLAWREATVLRAYAKYLRQAGFTFSQNYLEAALFAHPKIAALLVALFCAKFAPKAETTRKESTERLSAEILQALDKVANADEDRILRRFLNLATATLRTNYYQTDKHGQPKDYISFKLDSRVVEDLPLPRPMFEIWVYSPRMEGIHLRGGKVARGGIRWSDRREDFRTEILGLIKAQMVKNAVIVPVGAKGGFVVKRPPATGGREAFLQEGVECYRTLIRGLLDITDNLKGNTLTPPLQVVRWDEDDPYLVVAADKGTATFSDIANALSLEYGFWLGDAFASGGSQGYDHKKMGITARGAWVAVVRHFREMGIDPQTQDFTAVGVGDMSGDVFGNGMLRSPRTKLVAAFDHRHIFIDPHPDATAGFAERARLFALPRSSWADYDPKLISKGGGVFERSAKTIPVSAEIKQRLAISKDSVTPTELMRAILCAPADLLFFGGIGNYIKASTENNADAGDRANDAIRVNGRDLRCKVVGEGANLGATQLGRIEFALNGGRIDTDAIDNSAGVDCSDHEVNIKILIDSVVAAGDITEKQRNTLLAAMTDEVGDLVLRDNYLQTQALSLIEAQAVERLDSQERLMRHLEKTGKLDRSIEFLPNDETIAERAAMQRGLTRPELSVLLAYGKIWAHEDILQSDLPDDPYLQEDLLLYFPTPLRAQYRDAALKHRLKREIISTSVTNSMINRIGGSMVMHLMERTGFGPAEIARAYTVVRDAYRLRELWKAIEKLDGVAPAPTLIAMLLEINRLIERATLWVLRYGPRPMAIGAMVSEYEAGIRALTESVYDLLPERGIKALGANVQNLLNDGVPQDVAKRIAGLIILVSALDIVRIASQSQIKVEDAGRVYFAIGYRFSLGWLRAAAERISSGTHWQKLAVAAVIEELYAHQRDITLAVLASGMKESDPARAIEAWAANSRAAVDRLDQLIADLRAAPVVDLAMLAVASRALRATAGT